MRVRTLAKLILVLAVIAVVYFAARFFFPEPFRMGESHLREWWYSPKIQAFIGRWDKIEREGMTIHYKGIEEQKAESVLEVLLLAKKELAASFGVKFPETVDQYIVADPSQGVYYETDARTQVVVNLPTPEDWRPEGFGGTRNHVAALAYSMSLWANCFEKTDPDYPETPFGSSLATFLTWNAVVPAIARQEGELAWRIPYNYWKSVNPERYAELVGNPPEARTQDHNWGPLDTFWLHALRKHGLQPIASALQDACELLGDHKIEELAQRLEEETGDAELSRELRLAAERNAAPEGEPTVPPGETGGRNGEAPGAGEAAGRLPGP